MNKESKRAPIDFEKVKKISELNDRLEGLGIKRKEFNLALPGERKRDYRINDNDIVKKSKFTPKIFK